jgi:hypothetical protein
MKQRHLRLGYHLVTFLDVLGQRNLFKDLRLPETPEESAEVGEVLRQTAGFVLDLRETFADQCEWFEAGLTRVRQATGASVRPKFMGSSDSFVTSVPLQNPGGDLIAIISVFSSLAAAAIVMLTSLASKHPLRGVIDVGIGTEISKDEIYGTALERAYVLESRDAGYPRIVIGDELWNYLQVGLANFQRQTTPEAISIAGIIGKMMGLISVDGDGKRILDYLGPVIREIPGADQKARELMVKPAYEFVLAEQERINQEGDPRLIARYQAFRDYLESRVLSWGVDAKQG